MTTALPIMKNVLTPLAKNVLVLLGLPLALAIDAVIKKNYESGMKHKYFQMKTSMVL